MARPRNEREARRAGWTETQIRHDWPLRKKRENLTDGQGPPMWDEKTEDEKKKKKEQGQ